MRNAEQAFLEEQGKLWKRRLELPIFRPPEGGQVWWCEPSVRVRLEAAVEAHMEKVAVLQLRWERSRQQHVDMCVIDARKAVSDQTEATVAKLIDAHQHALAALECERDYWEMACTKAMNYIDKMEAHEADSARLSVLEKNGII